MPCDDVRSRRFLPGLKLLSDIPMSAMTRDVGDLGDPLFPKRLFQARALRRKQFSAALSDVHVIFQANAELAADVNARLITETHARGQRHFVAADKIRPFMAVHANTMSNAVTEVRIVRTVAGIGDDLARRSIYGFTRDARLGGG